MAGGKSPYIGIDLGTTYSCVAVFKNGKVEVVENLDGKWVTPSCIAFAEEEILIGDQALYNLIYDSKNTIYDVKRMIGRRFDDEKLQEDARRWQFKVIRHENKPKVQVKYKGETKTFSPEELSCMVLSRMKEIASGRLGIDVSDRSRINVSGRSGIDVSGRLGIDAVITVPAYFSLSQRKATKDAARIAGLEVLATINEPTAAAIAYGLQEKIATRTNVLVYDLGGGTFDVTIMTIDKGHYVVKASCGDSNLGGQDFNENLAKFLAEKFKKEHGQDLEKGEPMERLRQECERVKIFLSTNRLAQVNLPGLQNSITFHTRVSRAKFEDLNEDLFQKTLTAVQTAIKDAGMAKEKIDEIVAVGGSTKIPRIKELLEVYFEPKRVLQTINPDEAVAKGAASYAAFLNHQTDSGIKSVQDITPLSLGVGCKGDLMSFVVPRGTKVPCKISRGQYYTVEDNQRTVKFPIYEGERKCCKDNLLLGSFTLHDIERALAGKAEFRVTFEIDKDRSALEVTAVEVATGKSANVTICLDEGMLSEEEVAKLVRESEDFREADKRWRERTIAMNELQSSVYAARRRLREEPLHRRALRESVDILEWAEGTEGATMHEIKEKRDELERLLERCSLNT